MGVNGLRAPMGLLHRLKRSDEMAHDVQRRRLLLCGAVLIGVCATPAWTAGAAPDPPARVIGAFDDSLLAVMKQAKELGVRGRYEKLAAPIQATFDLAAMTRIAVGGSWNSIPSDVQTALIDSFTRMTIATYANRFDGYSGERFEVEPESETRSTGRIVHTKLLQSNGEAVTLNYLMRESGASWKVIDVYLTGTISELATRRAEFAQILKSGGASALVDSLRHKADTLLGAAAAQIP